MLKVKTLKDVVLYVISIKQIHKNKKDFLSFFHQKKMHGNFDLTDLISHDNINFYSCIFSLVNRTW